MSNQIHASSRQPVISSGSTVSKSVSLFCPGDEHAHATMTWDEKADLCYEETQLYRVPGLRLPQSSHARTSLGTVQQNPRSPLKDVIQNAKPPSIRLVRKSIQPCPSSWHNHLIISGICPEIRSWTIEGYCLHKLQTQDQ